MINDAGPALLGVLERYFSPQLARTLLTVTRRREGLEHEALGNLEAPRVVTALERALPGYLADTDRRQACCRELRALSAGSPAKQPAGTETDITTSFEVRGQEDLHRVNETVRSLCREIGMSPLDQTKLTTAASELTRNVLQYAGSGHVHVTRLGARRGLQIIAEDRGPGIADVELVLSARYASRTGMGMGLKGTKRIVDEFHIDSAKGRGTRVSIRKYV